MKSVLVKWLIVSVVIVSAAFGADPEAIPLWPGQVPGETHALPPEKDMTTAKDRLVDGRPVVRIGNVAVPTITIYSPPRAKRNGTAVLVCPGGGYSIVAIDLEGTDVCSWLNSIGVTAVLLKYRVPRREGLAQHVPPLQDAQRAMGLIRARAAELGIDRNRVGVLGFSAGAHLGAVLGNQPLEGRTYPPIDEADKLSSHPDFSLLIYPGYLALSEKNFAIAPEVVPKFSPPTFLVMAEDDPVHVENAVLYYLELKRAGVSAEMHLYPTGGHGYGLRRTENLVTTWPDRAADWLRSSGWLRAKN
ncbi:MAG TPA: alpha/beta hydrolase [Opitutaceae bacterium]|nr:alpha/beta hydrolase [Opitutaceae bacterium]